MFDKPTYFKIFFSGNIKQVINIKGKLPNKTKKAAHKSIIGGFYKQSIDFSDEIINAHLKKIRYFP